MIKIMMMLLMIYLSSCVSGPLITPRLSYEAKISRVSDGIYSGRCRLRCLDLMKIEQAALPLNRCGIDSTAKALNYPLNWCHGSIGFNVDDYGINIKPWLIESKEYAQDMSKSY
ncbi:MAG: hypothetical protein IMF01_09370 [Proteobacteria bacterium]|nr:hypothetical protein [Pseudomonadota bacterium]